MDVKAWRDKVLEYDNDPRTTAVSSADKTRFTFLAYGDDEALSIDPKKLTMNRLRAMRDKDAFKLSKAKKEQIRDEAARVTREFRGEDG